MRSSGSQRCLLAALLFGVVLCALPEVSQAAGWEKVDEVLRNGIAIHTTPGLQALVADQTVRTTILAGELHSTWLFEPPNASCSDPVPSLRLFRVSSTTRPLETTLMDYRPLLIVRTLP
jgi:hypothetical protein